MIYWKHQNWFVITFYDGAMDKGEDASREINVIPFDGDVGISFGEVKNLLQRVRHPRYLVEISHNLNSLVVLAELFSSEHGFYLHCLWKCQLTKMLWPLILATSCKRYVGARDGQDICWMWIGALANKLFLLSLHRSAFEVAITLASTTLASPNFTAASDAFRLTLRHRVCWFGRVHIAPDGDHNHHRIGVN